MSPGCHAATPSVWRAVIAGPLPKRNPLNAFLRKRASEFVLVRTISPTPTDFCEAAVTRHVATKSPFTRVKANVPRCSVTPPMLRMVNAFVAAS